jgi:hypothetical protein
MRLYFRCTNMESFFQITKTVIKALKVQLEKLKYGALSASSAKSDSVRL